MHISDGVLPLEVVVGGFALSGVGLAASLRRFDDSRAPELGVLAGLFFVASSFSVPAVPGSVHFLLNGLLGVVLGLAAIPCIFVGLFFQAAFLGHGGLTTLGVNTVVLGSGALAAHAAFLAISGRKRGARGVAAAFVGGASAVIVSALVFVLVLSLAGRSETVAASALVLPHLVLAVLEGVLVMSASSLILRVRPELFSRERKPAGRSPRDGAIERGPANEPDPERPARADARVE